MQRKFEKRNVYNAGKGKLNQELVYLHMSNHYRRLLNAKKLIDNSPPYCYKEKRFGTRTQTLKTNRILGSPALTYRSLSTNSNKGSCWGGESLAGSSRYHAHCVPEPHSISASTKQTHIDMDLVDRITFDTKNGPAAYCEGTWRQAKAQPNVKTYKPVQNKTEANAKRHLPTSTSREFAQKRKLVLEKTLKSNLTGKENTFKPRILKTEAVSKLRSLRVYHPPRRKAKRNEQEHNPKQRLTCSLNTANCKCTKICVCDSNETSLKKTSLNPKEQSLTSSRDSAYNGGVSSLPESRSPTPDDKRKKKCCCCCCEKKQRDGKLFESLKSPPSPRNQKETLKKIQEDGMYVKFVQDITTEVLEKNLYTNKAVKKVMKKHIKNNLEVLDKDRMLKEVENLRIQLGIPEDKTLLNIDFEPEEVNSDIFKNYPVISDSEFVMPKTESVPKRKSGALSSSTENDKPSSTEDDEGEIISVIQVTKAIRERRKEKTVQKMEGTSSSSESGENRSALKNFKQKVMRSYSPSSSLSSSDSGTTRKFTETTEGQKNRRSVSFWKTPEQNKSRTVEVKQKKTVTEADVKKNKIKQ